MKRALIFTSIGTALGIGIGATAQQAAKARPTYANPAYGFSIQAPDFPMAPASGMVVPVLFQAPPMESFASNVNVIVQPIKTSRQSYRDGSVAQFKEIGIKVKSERNLVVSGKEAVEWDYENEVQGKRLRFLQLAVVGENRVILATCTAPAAAFATYEPEFRASLASLKLLVAPPR